ncbi:MAG: DNA polymerase IV [bacterium]
MTDRDVIVHVDMDAFYAQVEKLDDEELHHEPVIVGGLGSRGVVATASYEAREYGVHSAMPMSQARELCPQAYFLPPRFDRYREISQQIHSIFDDYTDQVESLSLDEAYLDVTECMESFDDPLELGELLRKRVRKATSLTCSVGVGPNKLIAKMASEYCKPNGLKYVPDEYKSEFLEPLPIGELRGVGEKTERRMNKIGIETIGDLQSIDLPELQKEFDQRAIVYQKRAQGEDDSEVNPEEESKSISKETTFSEDLTDTGEMLSNLESLAEQVRDRLREKGYEGRTVKIKVRDSEFNTVTRRSSFDQPVDELEPILQKVRDLFQELDRGDRGIRLLGVGVHDLYPSGFQKDLFEDTGDDDLEGAPASEVIDQINDEYGRDTMKSASDL